METNPLTSQKQPIFNLPIIIPLLIGVMALVHFLRLYVASDESNYWIIVQFAFIPARYINAELLSLAPSAIYWTPLSYSFLHADWTHLIMNSFWLLAFGGVTARRLGILRFLILFIIGAIFGAGLHIIFHANEIAPMIGASASVSACMGAAIRLPAFSQAKFEGDISEMKIRTVMETLENQQAITFIVLWFGINLLFGSGVIDITGSGNPIAWEAHIGGFFAGFFLFDVIDRFFNSTRKTI